MEAELGGPQEYFEVTAEPQAVKVFVALEDASKVAGYVYVEGELAPPGPSEPAEGSTFAASAIDFDPDTVLDQVVDEVPDATITTFSIIGAGAGSVHYGAFAESERGGRLDITLAADGEVLGVGPAD